MRCMTLLTEPEKLAFASRLRESVETACLANPGLEQQLADRLKWPNLSRLGDYERGKFFVSPVLLVRIARVIGADCLSLLADAGYLREVLPLLHALSQFDDSEERRERCERGLPDDEFMPSRKVAIRFAFLKFPLRHEERNAYGDALLSMVFGYSADRAKEALDGRSRLPKYLRAASDALASDLDTAARLSIAAEYVRAWARSIDPDFTRALEGEGVYISTATQSSAA